MHTAYRWIVFSNGGRSLLRTWLAFWLFCSSFLGAAAQDAVVADRVGPDPSAQQGGRYPGLDAYQRQISTANPEVQRWFNQGILLLYGFNHDEAIRSFEQAAALDPGSAMAWWGSAYARGMHINKPEMKEEQSRLAWEAAQRAVAALDAESPVEQALVRAVATRYAWPAPADRKPLDQAYADAMEKVYHQFPDDLDVATLYAEALMDLQPWDLWTAANEPKGRALEIVALLEKVLAKNPKHPGACHFHIHAVEASPWPQRAIPAADTLVDLVPGSGHLVHMPSHIFIRVGRYADAVTSNQRAIAADTAYLAQAPPPDFYSLYYMHNVHFLAYAAMMDGRYQTALSAARRIEHDIPQDFLKNYVEMADGLMSTPWFVLIRFGKWNEILAEPEPPAWRLLSRAEWHYARSVALANLNRCAEAAAEIDKMDAAAAELTDTWKMGNNTGTAVLAIARKMAAGELAFRNGDRPLAFALLREAVALEDELIYDEPPGWMLPVRHALGALLLADQRGAEAEEVYRADLAHHPNNAWSLLGLQQALAQQNKLEDAEALADQVETAWARADNKPPASCFCHPEASPLRQ